MNAIEIKNLKKSYGKTLAVKGISFNIRKNEILGLLGPNGAGKTTIIKILAGVLTKDSGKIKILGKDPDKEKEFVANRMNVASPDSELTGIMTVYQNLKVYGKLYGVKNIKERIDYLLDLFEIKDLKHQKLKHLSKGQSTRVLLCKGIINNPEVLLLDECTLGLDPHIAYKTRKIIKELNATILFTSHNMHEVEWLCDRIAFMDKGKILKIGTVSSLKKLIKTEKVKMKFDKSEGLANFFKKLDIKILSLKGDTVVFEIDYKKHKLQDLIEKITKQGFKINDIIIKKASLEDIFIKVAKREL
ncbi:MAG: ABC transporter ATP-binding protein [Nanoarchaeota archaeon]|nr:ABC transporter ATP-binding protein [Nanoarchaeota archaeon]